MLGQNCRSKPIVTISKLTKAGFSISALAKNLSPPLEYFSALATIEFFDQFKAS
jgi:hypothetical protein